MEYEKEEEHLVFIIRSTNIIETKMKKIISAYIKTPDEAKAFVHSYLLNNSTISFGAKVRLILNIAKELGIKVNRDKFHTLLSRRNAFAHQDHLESIRTVRDNIRYPDVSYVVESIKGSGNLETVTHEKAMAEFMESYVIVEKHLDILLEKLNE